jgi:hypothetical protein
MNPISSFDEKDVIAEPNNVGDLKHEEDVPCGGGICRVVEGDDAGNKLWRDDIEASSVGDPTKDVSSTTTVTLQRRKQRVRVLYIL